MYPTLAISVAVLLASTAACLLRRTPRTSSPSSHGTRARPAPAGGEVFRRSHRQ